MNLTIEIIIDAITAWNVGLRYPKEPTGELCRFWHGLMLDENVTAEEFGFAARAYAKSRPDFPSPSEILAIIRTRRNYHASLPFADPRQAIDAPQLPAESTITTEEHRAKRADLEAKYRAAASDSADFAAVIKKSKPLLVELDEEHVRRDREQAASLKAARSENGQS